MKLPTEAFLRNEEKSIIGTKVTPVVNAKGNRTRILEQCPFVVKETDYASQGLPFINGNNI